MGGQISIEKKSMIVELRAERGKKCLAPQRRKLCFGEFGREVREKVSGPPLKNAIGARARFFKRIDNFLCNFYVFQTCF